MPVYDVYDVDNPNKRIGSFDGKIDTDSFKGTWEGEPLNNKKYNSWIIKKNDIVVMEKCYLECVDAFDIDKQFIFGRGILLKDIY